MIPTMSRLLALLFLLGGCGGSSANKVACDARAYPCGPYGYAAGSVIGDPALLGQKDVKGNGSAVDDPLVAIRFADYFHDSNLSALAIIIGAETCVPCQ